MGGWETKKLREVCVLDKSQGNHVGLPYIGMEDIESNTGRFLGSTEPTEVKSSTFRFNSDHVLYGRLRPYLNKVYLPVFEGHCSTEIFPIKPSESISREYLSYWFLMETTVNRINATCTGARMPRANMDAVLDFDFLLPPLKEQHKIVTTLDNAFAAIATATANAEKNLQNARELFDRTLEKRVFPSSAETNWEKTTVERAAQSEKGAMRTGPFGSQLLKREFVDDGIPVLGIDNVVANYFQWGKSRFITPKKFEELSRFQVKPGDVLITIMGTCGRCAIVPDDIPTAINTKHICCITLDRKKCLPEYLHLYFLHSPTARKYLSSKAKGAIMAGLNMGLIKELPLFLPSLDEQRQLVVKANQLRENVQRLEVIYKQKLDELAHLKQSLLKKAFAGELHS